MADNGIKDGLGEAGTNGEEEVTGAPWQHVVLGSYGGFRKLGVPYVGVLIISKDPTI